MNGFLYMMVLFLVTSKECACKEHKSTFKKQLAKPEGKEVGEGEEIQSATSQQISTADNYKENKEPPSSRHSYANYILKWIALSKKQNKLNNDIIISQYLHSTDTENKDIKILSRIKRCRMNLDGRKKRMFDEACIPDSLDGPSVGGGGGGSGAAGESTAATAMTAPSFTSKRPTSTITPSSPSITETRSILPTTTITNEPIHTESIETGIDTAKSTDQVTTLSTFQSGVSTYLPTTSAAKTTSTESASTLFIPTNSSGRLTTPMLIPQQTSTSTHYATYMYIPNTQTVSLKNSITPSSANSMNLQAAQSTTLQSKSTTLTITSLSTEQETTYPKLTMNFPKITETIYISSQPLVTTRPSAKNLVSVPSTSLQSFPQASVSTLTTSINDNWRVSATTHSTNPTSITTVVSSVESSLQPVSKDVISANVVSILLSSGTIDLSYPANQTATKMSTVFTRQLLFMSASTAATSNQQEHLTTTVTPMNIPISKRATPSLQAQHSTLAKATSFDVMQTISEGSLSRMPSKNSETVTKRILFSTARSFHSERVTISTALSTNGGKLIKKTVVSKDVQTQATSAALNTGESDGANTGIFKTAPNVAIVSTVATSVVLMSAVLLIYFFKAQTRDTRQLSNSVAHGHESQGNLYDTVSSTTQDRGSPSSATYLISGSSPRLTPVEVHNATG